LLKTPGGCDSRYAAALKALLHCSDVVFEWQV
jgi:hypothetical protein